ncbi:Patellin-3 [Ranunculus cassubicifolius]
MAEETAPPMVAPVPVKEKVAEDTPPQAEEKASEVETEKPKSDVEDSAVTQSISFKEESNRVADLEDPEKKALDEFKALIQQALNNHEFTLPPPPPPAPKEEEESPAPVAAVVEETPKVVEPEKVAATVSDEAPKPAEPEVVVVEPEEVKEAAPTAVVVDEDGAKTVEAIEETIVSVAKESTSEETTPAIETKEESPATEQVEQVPPPPPEEVFIWGIPLLGEEKSDTILLKFLRARDFKVKDAFTMLKNAVLWRKEFGIDGLLEEDLGTDLDKVVFMSGFDKEAHPVCYNVYGEFQNKELYHKIFADEGKGNKFLRWRIQFLEKSIEKLDFSPGAICTIVQVNDLKNSPGPLKKELRQATNQALSILQDNYPEFVAKQIFINVPWWYLAFNRMISPFFTQRTKSKMVFAGPSKSAETLFKYIAPEQVPVQYGGLSKEGEQEFSTADAVTEVAIKPATKQTVEIPVTETCLLVWELRVIGWEVSYGAEFVPSAEDGYTIIVQKTRKISATDEPVISNSFKVGEPGKVVLTIDNSSSKKKKLLYRFKTKPCSD